MTVLDCNNKIMSCSTWLPSVEENWKSHEIRLVLGRVTRSWWKLKCCVICLVLLKRIWRSKPMIFATCFTLCYVLQWFSDNSYCSCYSNGM